MGDLHAQTAYSPESPDLGDTLATSGPTLLDFGTNWCGHCSKASGMVGAAVARLPEVRHLRVEDGPGRRLGRQFGVKLWPTLVFLRDGQEVCRLVRPALEADVTQALERITARA